MKRVDIFRIYKASSQDPKKHRFVVILSRQALIDSHFSTVICAPIYSRYQGLNTQVPIGLEAGLKHDSAIFCDELLSIPKIKLKKIAGSLNSKEISQLDQALVQALSINN